VLECGGGERAVTRPGSVHARLAELYTELAKQHATLAVDASQRERELYVDQHDSPLGPRVHCRLIRAGIIPGYRVGRRFLATLADIRAYLTENTVDTAPQPSVSEDDEVMATLNRPRRKRAS
jgi:hypothetical protein